MSSPESSEKRFKARPKLSEMPDNLKEMIAENADLKTRYTIRKVSTHFRAAVDALKFQFRTVTVAVYTESISIRLNDEPDIQYRKYGENACVVKEGNRIKQVIEGEDYIQRAVDDLAIILKSPKGSVEWLRLTNAFDKDTNIRFVQCLQEKFGSFSHKLSFRTLTTFMCTDQDHVLGLLRPLKPGILKSLTLIYLNENCDRIAETEHWPLLEVAHVGDVEGVPISKFLHLRKFRIGAFPLTKDDVEQIVQSILQRPANFETYEFSTLNDDMIPIWKEALSDYWPARPIIPIPGTDQQLEIRYNERTILFSRTDR